MNRALVLAALVLLLAGCGHVATSDPFVGTWQKDSGETIVVGKQGDAYRVIAFVNGNELVHSSMKRDGDWLEGKASFSGGPLPVNPQVNVGYEATSGQLTSSFIGGYFKKVSDSTATPSGVQ